MRKKTFLYVVFQFSIFILAVFFSFIVTAGQAGVGVINVPPKFSDVRIVRQDDSTLRVYLTVSDYNSWEDIDNVQIILDDAGVETAKFVFKQYADADSFVKINEFSDLSGENNLLLTDKCSFNHSDIKETINERCDLSLLFVFHTSWFTRLNIIVSDRAGEAAASHFDYNLGEMTSSNNMLLIPCYPKPIIFGVPPYLIDIIAVVSAAVGTIIVFKKGEGVKSKRASYEK